MRANTVNEDYNDNVILSSWFKIEVNEHKHSLHFSLCRVQLILRLLLIINLSSQVLAVAGVISTLDVSINNRSKYLSAADVSISYRRVYHQQTSFSRRCIYLSTVEMFIISRPVFQQQKCLLFAGAFLHFTYKILLAPEGSAYQHFFRQAGIISARNICYMLFNCFFALTSYCYFFVKFP